MEREGRGEGLGVKSGKGKGWKPSHFYKRSNASGPRRAFGCQSCNVHRVMLRYVDIAARKTYHRKQKR